jgi:hypothetical protein
MAFEQLMAEAALKKDKKKDDKKPKKEKKDEVPPVHIPGEGTKA